MAALVTLMKFDPRLIDGSCQTAPPLFLQDYSVTANTNEREMKCVSSGSLQVIGKVRRRSGPGSSDSQMWSASTPRNQKTDNLKQE